jgi:hypothetical protein
MSNLASCRCPHCNGNVDFYASQAGETIACPHCDGEILLSRASSESAPGTNPSSVGLGSKVSAVEIVLTSGIVLNIKEVRLYDAKELNDLAAQKAEAATLLDEISCPHGTVGDPLWMAYATKALGTMERKSREAAQTALASIQKLVEREKKLREDAKFFPVGQVQGIEKPVPGLWQVPSAESKFVHNGEEFVAVRDTGSVVKSIRWSCVESYGCQADK